MSSPQKNCEVIIDSFEVKKLLDDYCGENVLNSEELKQFTWILERELSKKIRAGLILDVFYSKISNFLTSTK